MPLDALTRPASTTSLFGPVSRADGLIAAAWVLSLALAKGRALDARVMRSTMEDAFSASDAQGAWVWRDAYEAAELAQVLYLRRHGEALVRTSDPAAALADIKAISALSPSQTRRSEDQVAFQQFSTPLDLAYVASVALDARPSDVTLEPSAGTGLLAVFAELAGARLHLNELDPKRADLLASIFRDRPVTRLNAEQINDRLGRDVVPTLVVMNPPFSASPDVATRMKGADFRHIRAALARLAPGGRLVAITGASLSPAQQPDRFDALAATGATLRFSCALNGAAYARHGTTTDTRLTVIDKLVDSNAPAALCPPMAQDTAELLSLLAELPPRANVEAVAPAQPGLTPLQLRPRVRPPSPATLAAPTAAALFKDVRPLSYEIRDASPGATGTAADGIYETYAVETISIPGAQPHPSSLVQSVAMAAVRLPRPTYRPHLPHHLVTDGILSEAQLETIIYAGEAHSTFLAGHWRPDETFDTLNAADATDPMARPYRRGFFLGDGTGAGKGRQAAGCILDNWLQGRRKALWVSKNEPLLEDARRDWSALGGNAAQVQPQSRFKHGAKIGLSEGIMFTTYATLRSGARGENCSRLDQMIEWLGRDFDGVIILDEAHALANAAVEKGARGDRGPSEQGKMGLRLQNALPNARVLYVSATGATVVTNLGYAARLGLWGGENFPFPTRASFIAAMEAGGVAAMEVLARDLKSLGLYTARSLSYAGVEYELVEHTLTPEQVAIYDAYADAFSIIHNNLEEALQLTGIADEFGGTLNRHAKAAARSAFESAKQRFFSHTINGMAVPTLIANIEEDLRQDVAPVIQLVSTGEAVSARRLTEVPVSEWNDLQIDVTPREYVMDYLKNSFPTALFEPYTDEEGNIRSRPSYQDGHQLQCADAVAARDALLEQLGALPPIPTTLDQIIQHFGADDVAEVTGRSRRIVRKSGPSGDRLAVERRPASANADDAAAFMDGKKRILVFSDAGGTGRSYHADRGAKNQRRRHHYLADAGWRADVAVQGLGRTNRTNQVSAPLFKPLTTNVKGQKRFISTIARRLDSLGALTKGQRQTGGQGLFRPEDNLESDYAKAALRRLYIMLYRGQVEGMNLADFEAATGLSLVDKDGSLKENLPPITQFLNRVLALRVAHQDSIFERLNERIEAEIEAAQAAGTFEVGVETLTADRFDIVSQQTIYTHPTSGAQTQLIEIRETTRVRPLSSAEAIAMAQDHEGLLMVNAQSGRAGLVMPTASRMYEDGSVEARVRIYRPIGKESASLQHLSDSQWTEVEADAFARAWNEEILSLPTTRTETFHLVTGLLLPIWARLPGQSCRVYRLQAVTGERLIGRVIEQDSLAALCKAFGLDAPAYDPAAVWSAVVAGHSVAHLANGVQIRQVRVMGVSRVEVVGFAHDRLPALKAAGMITEIISWKTRLFIPLNDAAPRLFADLAAQSPVVNLSRRG